jgi:hypothetical protein
MEIKNNPAGRLVDILSAARRSKDDERSRSVWGKVFNIDEKNTGELLRALADLIHLVHETRSALEKIPDIDHKLYLRPFTRIDTALSNINLDAGWTHWKSQFDEHLITQLQYASDKLGRISGTSTIKPEKLNEIRNQLDSLTQAILESDLPEELKGLLVRNVEDLRRAVLSYQIRGLEGIEQELARSIGSMLLNKKKLEAAAGQQSQKSLFQKYFKVILMIDKLVAIAKNATQIGAPVLGLLVGHSIDIETLTIDE